jgi:predicted RNA binding protein with dsRBD fold (UPF0201 family)
MNKIAVRIEAEVNPTEDVEKVKKAVENIVWNAEYIVKPQNGYSLLIAEAEGRDSLTKIHNLLRLERIRAAARTVLFSRLSHRGVVFYLNKQVAYVGHLSFSDPEETESPLGPIKVEILCDEPRELVEWLTKTQ